MDHIAAADEYLLITQKQRCKSTASGPLVREYYDMEWVRPVHDPSGNVWGFYQEPV